MEIRLATEKFLGELRNLESQYDGTMKAVAGDTDAVGKSLEQSFKVLGIKSVQSVEQEIKQLQAALAQIRNAPDVLPADKAAAVAAFNNRLVELRGQAQQMPPALAGVGTAADKTGTSLASAAHKAVAWTAALAAAMLSTWRAANSGSAGTWMNPPRAALACGRPSFVVPCAKWCISA